MLIQATSASARYLFSKPYRFSWFLPTIAVCLVAMSGLVFDALTPDVVSVCLFYVSLVLLGFWFSEQKAALPLAMLATALIIAGHWITNLDNPPAWEGWLNRALAVGTVWLSAVFVWRIRVLQKELQIKVELADSLSREINHRVGNHLQLVASFLKRQAEGCEIEPRRVLALAGSRVETIGGINRQLSPRSPWQTIDSRSFIIALVNDIRAALADPGIEITVFAASAEFKSTEAAALGAVLVELLNNALKYAFANGLKGKLVVNFEALGDRHVLELEDDGVGIDEGRDADGFGRRSLSNLVRAMGGSITCQPARQSKSRPGTKWRVEIPA